MKDQSAAPAPADQLTSSLTAAIKEKIGEWRRRGDLCRHSSRALKTERGKAYLECAAELEQLPSRLATAPKDGTMADDKADYWLIHTLADDVKAHGSCERTDQHGFGECSERQLCVTEYCAYCAAVWWLEENTKHETVATASPLPSPPQEPGQ